jgi:hypothetical protein
MQCIALQGGGKDPAYSMDNLPPPPPPPGAAAVAVAPAAASIPGGVGGDASGEGEDAEVGLCTLNQVDP